MGRAVVITGLDRRACRLYRHALSGGIGADSLHDRSYNVPIQAECATGTAFSRAHRQTVPDQTLCFLRRLSTRYIRLQLLMMLGYWSGDAAISRGTSFGSRSRATT